MKRVIVIAEAGVNHNGDINLAKQLIDVAAEAGVDADGDDREEEEDSRLPQIP